MLYATIKNKWVRMLMAIAGCVINALGVNLFLVPLELYNGGLMGASQLVRTITYQLMGVTNGYDFSGIVYYLFNVPLFLAAFRFMGKEFLRNSILCVTTYTLTLSLVPIPAVPLVSDRLIGCMLAGAAVGLGCGITLTCGASSGGTDILGLYFAKRGTNFTVGRLNLIFNIVVYGLCGILFGAETMIYSILYAIFAAAVLDRVHQQSINVQATIFTKDHAVDLSDYIMEHLHRGVTWWDARGAYTGDQVKVICVCLSKYEINGLQEELRRQDPHAFCIIQEGVHLSGNFVRHMSSADGE